MDVETQDVTELATYDFSNFTPTNPKMLYYDEVNQFVANGSIYVEFTTYYQVETANGGNFGQEYIPEYLPFHFIIRFIKQASNLVIYNIYEIPNITRYDQNNQAATTYFPIIGAIPNVDGSLIYAFYASGYPYNPYIDVHVLVRESNDMVPRNSGRLFYCGTIQATTDASYNQQTQQYEYFLTPIQRISAACSNNILAISSKDTIQILNIVGTQLPLFYTISLDESLSTMPVIKVLRVEDTRLHTNFGVIDIQNANTASGPQQLYSYVDPDADSLKYIGPTINVANPLSVSGYKEITVQQSGD